MSLDGESLGKQLSETITLCSNVTATGGAGAVSFAGYNGSLMAEITAIGTSAGHAVTLAIEGSYDGTNWYTCGIQQLATAAAPGNGVTAPARAVTTGSIVAGNGTVRQSWQILDAYPYYQADPTANTLDTGVTVKVYAMPV
jgi:hypothetical protein